CVNLRRVEISASRIGRFGWFFLRGRSHQPAAQARENVCRGDLPNDLQAKINCNPFRRANQNGTRSEPIPFASRPFGLTQVIALPRLPVGLVSLMTRQSKA